MDLESSEVPHGMSEALFKQILGQVENVFNEWQDVLEVLNEQLSVALVTLKEGLEKQVQQLKSENAKLKDQLANKELAHSELLEKLQRLELLCSQFSDIFKIAAVKPKTPPDIPNPKSVLSDDGPPETNDRCALIVKLVIEKSYGFVAKAWKENKEEFVKHGIRKRKTLQCQIWKCGLSKKCKKVRAEHCRSLIEKLVIKQNNGLVTKTWNYHSKELIENGIEKKEALKYQVVKCGLAKKCKTARFRHYRKVITAKLLKKHNYNFIKVASELEAPRTEVCTFCKEFMASNQ